MKKLQLQVLIIACSLVSTAQTDSLKKIKFSGCIIEMYGVGRQDNYSNSQAGFQKYIYDNELLNKDLSGYTHAYGGYSNSFNGSFSGRVFFELLKQKKLRKEYFIGLRGGTDVITGTQYFNSYSDTVGTYVNAANNTYLIEINTYNNSYNYQITSQRVLVPFGINLNTNKLRRLWFTAGIELSPGITFNNRFNAYFTSTTSRDIYDPLLSTTNNNFSHGNNVSGGTTYSSNKLKGIGVEGYASIPFGVNLRASKKISFLKNLNLNASIAPALCYSQNKFANSQASFTINASLGLRYNW